MIKVFWPLCSLYSRITKIKLNFLSSSVSLRHSMASLLTGWLRIRVCVCVCASLWVLSSTIKKTSYIQWWSSVMPGLGRLKPLASWIQDKIIIPMMKACINRKFSVCILGYLVGTNCYCTWSMKHSNLLCVTLLMMDLTGNNVVVFWRFYVRMFGMLQWNWYRPDQCPHGRNPFRVIGQN